jgi:DNA-binding transcriptional MerR regulator
MFPLEFIMSHTELSERSVLRFERLCGLTPSKQGGLKYYTLSDLIVFKMMAILKRNGLTLDSIEKAVDCLRNLKPEQSLSALVLYHDGHSVYDLTEVPPINASRSGQVVMPSVMNLTALAMGTELDSVRKKAQNARRKRDTEIQKATPTSLEALRHQLRDASA